MAVMFDMLIEWSMAKPSLKKGALVRTPRALRSVCNQTYRCPSGLHLSPIGWWESPEFIATLLVIAKTSQAPTRLVMLLGVSISVLIRLKNIPEALVQRLPTELKACPLDHDLCRLDFARMGLSDFILVQF
ncbi:hypothetical protein GALMADRAFT_227307 [Galerina marginata CBS 339.88]|uniref:Uncharacterized protein n=1 Tax=Galerina marginata (strain CBS 339.88) TaxID=685588 RepID=A0A067STD5_GALM3|nr:hypothetical protein GALMADRAFT_227307 [Galerina marginata CBS 339.88]